MSTRLARPMPMTPAQVVWTLIRVIQGDREIVGQYSSELNGMQEVQRVIARQCDLKQMTHLPKWTTTADGQDFHFSYGVHSFWFRLEPWPLDGEA